MPPGAELLAHADGLSHALQGVVGVHQEDAGGDHLRLAPQDGKAVLRGLVVSEFNRRRAGPGQVVGLEAAESKPTGRIDATGKRDLVTVKALQLSVSNGRELSYNDWDGSYFHTTRVAAGKAYKGGWVPVTKSK